MRAITIIFCAVHFFLVFIFLFTARRYVRRSSSHSIGPPPYSARVWRRRTLLSEDSLSSSPSSSPPSSSSGQRRGAESASFLPSCILSLPPLFLLVRRPSPPALVYRGPFCVSRRRSVPRAVGRADGRARRKKEKTFQKELRICTAYLQRGKKRSRAKEKQARSFTEPKKAQYNLKKPISSNAVCRRKSACCVRTGRGDRDRSSMCKDRESRYFFPLSRIPEAECSRAHTLSVFSINQCHRGS